MQDTATGYRWVYKAARQGLVEAQFLIGQMYARGERIPRRERKQKQNTDGTPAAGAYDRFAPDTSMDAVKGKAKGGERLVLKRKAVTWLRLASEGGHPEAK